MNMNIDTLIHEGVCKHIFFELEYFNESLNPVPKKICLNDSFLNWSDPFNSLKDPPTAVLKLSTKLSMNNDLNFTWIIFINFSLKPFYGDF